MNTIIELINSKEWIKTKHLTNSGKTWYILKSVDGDSIAFGETTITYCDADDYLVITSPEIININKKDRNKILEKIDGIK